MNEKVKLYEGMHGGLIRHLEHLQNNFQYSRGRCEDIRKIVLCFITRIDREKNITKLQQVDPDYLDEKYYNILNERYPKIMQKMGQQAVRNRIITYLRFNGLGM